MWLVYLTGTVVIVILLSMLGSVYWIDYQCKRMREEKFFIQYNDSCKGATYWRNTHPSHWKHVKMKRGSVIVMPSNMWIEINPKDATPYTFLHELGHIQMDIAWLTLEGTTYYHMIKASKDDLCMQAVLEFMAWGIATRLGKIDEIWLTSFMIHLYENLYGEEKVRTALLIATSTSLNKNHIVSSTRRILKVLYM